MAKSESNTASGTEEVQRRMKSPCKNVCKLVKRKNNGEEFCVGSLNLRETRGRTREEIRMWTRQTDEWRQKVIDRLRVT